MAIADTGGDSHQVNSPCSSRCVNLKSIASMLLQRAFLSHNQGAAMYMREHVQLDD